jgi:hypothetical protein
MDDSLVDSPDQHLHDTLDLAHRGKLLGTTFIRTC